MRLHPRRGRAGKLDDLAGVVGEDPELDAVLQVAAAGVRMGAGPPLQQLAVGRAVPEDLADADRWAIHAEVIRRALADHRQELTWLVGPDLELTWLDPPS